ncbi:MAG: DUF4097 family beta strand repeat-containing protein [candidate division Zixibacteria bacterium]
MSDFRKVFIASLIIVIAFSAMTLAGIKQEITRDFNVSPGGELTIDTEIGSIEVKASNQSNIGVEIILDSKTRDEDRAQDMFDDFEVEFNQDGNAVEIYAEYFGNDSRGWNIFGTRTRRSLQAKFIITVPEKYNVYAKTSGGSIHIGDLEGEVDVRTSGGSLRFDNISGPVKGKTSGGSITLESCKGRADVSTSGGSIEIGHVEGEVSAHTSGGGIEVEEVMGEIDASTSGGSIYARISEQPRGDCRLTTSGGGITVYLSPDINVYLDARTSSGRVKSDFDISSSRRKKKSSLRGEIGDGGPELYLRTSGGSIRILED